MPSPRLISILLISGGAAFAAYLMGEPLMDISAALTCLGAIAGAYVFSWQARIRPQDDQQWAALLFVFCVTLVLGLVAWRYIGGPVVGNTPQGVAAFCGVMIALIALAIETREVNLGILRRKHSEGSRRDMAKKDAARLRDRSGELDDSDDQRAAD